MIINHLAYLLGADEARLKSNPTLLGPMLENFVVMELHKQRSWSRTQPHLFHFRTPPGFEVDIVLENAAGQLVGIEVKASSSVKSDDFRGLRVLAEMTGDRFVRGIVLYTGDETVPFGPDLVAMPVSSLWSLGAE